jgi:hypothetical protein
MAGADYDGIGGVMRMLKAGQKPDTFAIEVVTFHAAIENEIELIISALVNRPDGLFSTSPKMSFGHKVNLLRAVWRGDPNMADVIHGVLHRFQDVRNAVAHPDPRQIKSCVAGLMQAYRKVDPSIPDEVPMLQVAQGICLFMQDGSTVTELKAAFDGLDHIVNVAMPQIGRPQSERG